MRSGGGSHVSLLTPHFLRMNFPPIPFDSLNLSIFAHFFGKQSPAAPKFIFCKKHFFANYYEVCKAKALYDFSSLR